MRQKLSTLHLTECQFADDAALIATTRAGMERAIAEFISVASAFGLTVSLIKTKFMVMGVDVQDEDTAPVVLSGSSIPHVTDFRYLGSLVDILGRSSLDIRSRIAAASKAFGALKKPVFRNTHLSVSTKRQVFTACVLPLLLYSAECWVPLQKDLCRLSCFYNSCIRSILGISKKEARTRRLSNKELLAIWGDARPISVILAQRRLEWLGHIARMPETRIPKALLFGLLKCRRPPGGPRKRWRDCVRRDLKALGALSNWYQTAQTRPSWRTLYKELASVSPAPTCPVQCPACDRKFSRSSDLKRHKCIAERQKPVHQQRGAIQCGRCHRWFKSRGGFAVHKCSSIDAQRPTITHGKEAAQSLLECEVCHRQFHSSSGFKRHKCSRAARKPQKRSTVTERESFQHSCQCGRKFRRKQDISRHQRFCAEVSTTSPPMGTM